MRPYLMIMIAALLSACVTIESLEVPVVSGPAAVPPGPGPGGPTVKFASITKNIPDGERTFVYASGFACSLRKEVRNNPGPYKDSFVKHVAIVVHDVLKEASYNVVGNPNDPFNEAVTTKADYLLGARVLDTKSSICYSGQKYSGKRYYRIEWSLLKSAGKKVVFTNVAEGYADIPEAITDGANKMTYDALRMSLRKALADRQFIAAMQ